MVQRFLLLLLCVVCTLSVSGQAPQKTRGIGQYPGAPTENFAPTFQKDKTYKNLALYRIARASSSYDENATAQLVTDGVIGRGSDPVHLRVSSKEGLLPVADREFSIDGGHWSVNTLLGENNYLQYQWNDLAPEIDEIGFDVRVAYRPEQATRGYSLRILTSDDGATWAVAGEESSTDALPGEISRWMLHSDPNKQTQDDMIPARNIASRVHLVQPSRHRYVRVEFSMAGAVYWEVAEIQFMRNSARCSRINNNNGKANVWMSASGGEEWVEIDLGTTADIDKCKLYWTQRPQQACIQLSDDGKTWETATYLTKKPKKDAQRNLEIDEIRLKKHAQFVRILMQQPNASGFYILNECEIFGRNGLTVIPSPREGMKNGRYSLNGGAWALTKAYETSAQPIVATVPATVLTSYINVGAIPDPNVSNNMQQISDSYFNDTFQYSTTFSLPESMVGKRVYLNLDGINWKATVYLNEQRLGTIEGAFQRAQFDITNYAKRDENTLKIIVDCPAHVGPTKVKTRQSTGTNGGMLGADNPTFHATVGWDWISSIRGRNTGVWSDVYLTADNGLTLSDPYIQTQLNLPDTLATLTPHVFVRNNLAEAQTAVVRGWIGNISFEKTIQILGNTEQEIVFSPADFNELRDQRMRLWWPNNYGEPYLYDAGFEIIENGTSSARINFKTGIRDIQYSSVDTRLQFFVNGVRVTPYGGNWGFSENNLQYRAREYDVAVGYHRDMHLNMIRNWVGQTGDKAFYDACDRYGIMVWQDFWLANPSDGPDPDDESMFMANANDYVRKIRQHASIAIYCGRNEGAPPASLDVQLRNLVATIHPNALYISDSADGGVSGHGPYRALSAKAYFENLTGKLHTERGMPNVVNYESLCRFMQPEERWPQNDIWGQHDYTLKGAQGATSFNELISKGFGSPSDAKAFCDRAQWINFNGYRAMYEAAQTERQGLLIWMSHPCWPTFVWQTYDYYFEPNAAFFGVKKACEPTHILYNARTREVNVVNLLPKNYCNATAKAQILNINGAKLWEKALQMDCESDTTQVCFAVPTPENVADAYFLRLQLNDERGALLSENFYVLSVIDDNYQSLNTLPKTELNVSFEKHVENGLWSAIAIVKNDSDTPAMMVRLNLVDANGEQILPVDYSENYFHLMPNEQKTIRITWKDEDTHAVPHLETSGMNVEVAQH